MYDIHENILSGTESRLVLSYVQFGTPSMKAETNNFPAKSQLRKQFGYVMPFGRLPAWTSYIHASELRRQWSAVPYSGDIATCGKSQFCKNKEDSFSKVH